MSETENAAFNDGFKRGVGFAMREFSARLSALETRADTSGKSISGLLTLYDRLESRLDEYLGRLDTLTEQLSETHHALTSRLKALEGRPKLCIPGDHVWFVDATSWRCMKCGYVSFTETPTDAPEERKSPDNPPTPPKEANPAEGSAQCPHCKRVFETIWRDARKGRFYCALCGEWFWVDATGQSQPTSPKEPDEIREGYRQGYEAGAEAVRLEKLLSKEPEGGKEGAPRYLQNAIETIRARRAKEGGTP